jgi:hypothetical protein
MAALLPHPPLTPEDAPQELYAYEVDQIEDDALAEGDDLMDRETDQDLNEET